MSNCGSMVVGLPDEISEKYSSGGCVWLALALHDLYGWQIVAQIERDPSAWVAHAFVRRPDGCEVDVLGVQGQVDIFSPEEATFSRCDFVRFLAKSNDVSVGDIEREYLTEKPEALRFIERYLWPAFAKENRLNSFAAKKHQS